MNSLLVHRVMLVDDNLGDLELTRTAFEEAGVSADFTVARSGAEAMRALDALAEGPASAHPELILLDLNMPQGNGHEVLAFLRTRPALAGIPVAVLTTSNLPSDRDRALAAGARLYLVKPRRFQELVALVEDLRAAFLPHP